MTKEELIKRKMEILQKWEDDLNKFVYNPNIEKEYKEYKEICKQIEQMEDND